VPRRLLAAFLALVAAGCDVKIQRGDEPEQPSPQIIALGPNPAFREQIVADAIERDRLCRAAGVAANDAYNRRRILACVDVNGRVTYLPPDASTEVLRHERAHEWGYQHDDTGHGFLWTGLPNALRTATTVNALRDGR
jgi:hypothetical protein